MTVADRTAASDRRKPRWFQLRVGKLLLLVAGCALVLGTWRFTRENSDGDRAFTSREVVRLRWGDDWLTRMSAAESLGQVTPEHAATAIPALSSALADPDPRVRSTAARSLGTVFHRGIANSPGEQAERMTAVVRALVGALEDRDARVRAAAARGLAALPIPRGPVVAPPYAVDPGVVLPPLIDALSDPEPSVREAAVTAIGVLAPKSENAPPILMATLDRDADQNVRAAAVLALGDRWKDADALLLALLGRLSKLDPVSRSNATWALSKLELVPPSALPALIEAMKAPENPVGRMTIPKVLARLGPAGKAALPALAEVARQQIEAEQPLTAVGALFAIDRNSAEAQSVLAPLVEAVRRPDRHGSRAEAANAIAQFGPSARAAVAPLRAARKLPDPEVRSLVEWILTQIEPGPR